jgi:hypothetical protein
MSISLGSRIAVIAAAALVLIAGGAIDIRTTLAAYLVAWTALGAIPIGALGVLMTTYLLRRAWTPALHPILVAATGALPLVALLFVPVLVEMPELYPAAAHPASLPRFKALYLAPWFFVLRSVCYFAIWSLLALWLRNAWHDSDRMVRAASAGLIVYALSLSLAGVDWMESLEPDFHSSIYGLLFISFAVSNGVAFAIGGGVLLRRRIGELNGYSALLLSTILLWAYLHAMQYIVIWSGNIPDEVTWYLKRSSGGWQFVLIVLALGQFVFPFFALLSESIRGDRRWLVVLCGLTLVMRILEAALLILPALSPGAPFITGVMLLAALILIGMVLWWGFEAALGGGQRSIIPRASRAHAGTE